MGRKLTVLAVGLVCACRDGEVEGSGPPRVDGGTRPPPTAPACEPAASGSPLVAELVARAPLAEPRGDEGWLGSPTVADLDGDGENEVVVPRDQQLVVWHADGTIAWRFATDGRTWASPVVADFRDGPELEVAIAARRQIHLFDAAGAPLSGFPVAWNDELRSLAAGDLDGDGQLDLVAATTSGGPGDVVAAWRASGAPLPGFPPLQSGSSGCGEGDCVLAGAYDQNLAIGDLDGQGGLDLVVPHDNAYASFHHGSGAAFAAAAGFSSPLTPGVRYLHALTEAQAGFAEDEETALQAHFTNTSPAIADVDGDGLHDVILVGSVQNASQSNREQGVALWVLRADASRVPGFDPPLHFPAFLGGFEDLEGNIVGQTQQVTVADLDPGSAGPELVVVGFGGRIHAVSAAGRELWSHDYSDRDDRRTAGVVVADLSGDGVPELVYATYSGAREGNELVVLDAGGNPVRRAALPRRGAMAMPTIADLDGDGGLEILVSLKDAADDSSESVQIFTVRGSATNCLLWPTGRANVLRNGWIP